MCLAWALAGQGGSVWAAAAGGTTGYVGASDRAVGTATVYADGAEIKAHIVKDFTISPLELSIISKPPYPIARDRVTITVSVSNAGSVAAERLTPELEILSGSIYISPLSGPLPAGQARIAPGSTESFSWTAEILGTGPIRVKARASGFLSGRNVPISGQAVHDLTSLTVAQLTADLTPNPLEVTGGKWFTLTITVSNTGGLPVTGVSPGLEATSGADLVILKQGPVPEKPVSLHPGGSQEFTFTFSANGSGVVSFSTTVQGQADLDPPGIMKRTSSKMAAVTRSAWRASAKTTSRWFKNLRDWIKPPAPPLPAERLFMGFESGRDLAWDTGGYVTLSGSGEHATEGNQSCKAEFALPDTLSSAPATGPFRPTFRRTAPARGTLPPLEPQDWSSYDSFRADCYNAAKAPLDLRVTLVDVHGFEFQALHRLPADGSTTIEVSLERARQVMLNAETVSELRISVDTAGLKERPVVFFDNFRFALPPPALSSTAASSSTVFRQSPSP